MFISRRGRRGEGLASRGFTQCAQRRKVGSMGSAHKEVCKKNPSIKETYGQLINVNYQHEKVNVFNCILLLCFQSSCAAYIT